MLWMQAQELGKDTAASGARGKNEQRHVEAAGLRIPSYREGRGTSMLNQASFHADAALPHQAPSLGRFLSAVNAHEPQHFSFTSVDVA